MKMKIVSITGAHSGVGKTSLAALILREIKGFSAIKVTKTELFTSLTMDEEVISEKGKDSCILKESGADKVIWVRSTYEDIKECLTQAVSMIGNSRGVIIEGNSPLDFIEPDLVIFLMKDDLTEMKASGRKALERADLVVINTKLNDPETLKKEIRDINPVAVVFLGDLSGGKIEKGFLDTVKKRIIMEVTCG